jgi:hypothetical protein
MTGPRRLTLILPLDEWYGTYGRYMEVKNDFLDFGFAFATQNS